MLAAGYAQDRHADRSLEKRVKAEPA
jgi:hypothetical protein